MMDTSGIRGGPAVQPLRNWRQLRTKLLLIYLVVAVAWIILSDVLVAAIAPTLAANTFLQTLKGLAFVGVTGTLVYLLLTRATAEMYRLQHNLRILADSTHDWEYWVDPNGSMLYVSPSCERITGYPPDTFYEDPDLFWRLVHPEDLPLFRDHHSRSRPSPDDDEIEFRIHHRDGRMRWLSHTSRPVINDEGKPYGRRGCNRDISARKETEGKLRMIESHLRQQQKLETVGLLASSIAHDINGPLMGILNYAEMTREDLEAAGVSCEMLDEILHEAERIRVLVKNGLEYCRDIHEEAEEHDLHDILDGVRTLVRTLLRHDGIELIEEFPAGLPPVRCSRARIQQVLLNLIVNARDALNDTKRNSTESKTITIRAAGAERDGNPMVHLSVEDNGTGISEELRPQLFTPFFSTKAPGQGTGLGLAICSRIIEDHKGRIEVSSQPGAWTRFEVQLPSASP